MTLILTEVLTSVLMMCACGSNEQKTCIETFHVDTAQVKEGFRDTVLKPLPRASCLQHPAKQKRQKIIFTIALRGSSSNRFDNNMIQSDRPRLYRVGDVSGFLLGYLLGSEIATGS